MSRTDVNKEETYMLNFHTIYHPITARPFLSDHTYKEYLPGEPLRPYIACYWTTNEAGTEGTIRENLAKTAGREVLVIPDTCVDIILSVNHTKQTMTGMLCGIQDLPFTTVQGGETDVVTVFAIRFHFWAVHLFLNLEFQETRNLHLDMDDLGKEWRSLFEPFFYLLTGKERIARVEQFLYCKLADMELNSDLFQAVHNILDSSGGVSVRGLCESCCVSPRKLERLFLGKIGLPPKKVATLVRYQNVWHNLVTDPQFDILDAVYRYGYTDQSHLQKEFRRFHGTSPEEARKIAQSWR